MSTQLIEYYQNIIPEKALLAASLEKPLPHSFWVNTLKTTSEQVLSYLAALGIDVEPIPWHPNAFRTYSEKIGRSWPYLLGLIQIQEEVSMLPGVLMEAKPGETIIDLCAAPGNKTAQLAVAMQNQGVLVANDNNYSRLRAMGQIRKRLGLLNISLSVCDAMKYPGLKNQFDRVLVDVPCSCEGTLRKRGRAEFKPSRHYALKMAHRQLLILKKAFQLCKPGGRIIYSTCTFSPEENERVVHELLAAVGDQVRVLPIKQDNFIFSPGITTWHNETFHPHVKNTMRVWPHQNNTGGFFVAMLEKCGDSSLPNVKPEINTELSTLPGWSILQDRFGFDGALIKDFYFKESAKGFYIVPRSAKPPEGVDYDATGLFFFKTRIQFPKLSTQAAMVFGRYATKHRITLDEEQFNAYLNREEFLLTESQIENCESTGYVLLFYQKEAIGMGLYFSAQAEKPPRCRSLLPLFLTL